MTKHLFARVLTAVALVVVAAVVAPTSAHAAVKPPAGLAHWASRTVYVVDTTGRDPLVAEAAAAWDRLGVIRVLSAPSCAHVAPCIPMGPARLPAHIGGVTPMQVLNGRVLAARVELSTDYPVGVKVGWDGIPAGWALSIRVHELGHALGIVPHAPQGTCAVMAPVACGTPLPTPYDAWLLQEAYRSR